MHHADSRGRLHHQRLQRAHPERERGHGERLGNLIIGYNETFSWNILFPPILTNAQMEDQKNFNTRMFAQRNEGHEFHAVLTDAERTIIEYLKTL